ncbi:MAG: chromosomal replication initiator protein DnaA, partial [Deltaproteobacteria bacterium]|nr:chromosomal replication initiator protein DnaA [Deltaproteobacteria bacterium]
SIIKKKNHPVSDINLRQIQRVTAKYFNIALRDLLSSKREKTFSYPRQVAFYLSKKLTSYSLKEIGNAFGNKHHSTIIYAVKRIEQGKSQNKGTLNDINTIQMLLARKQGS